MRKPARYTEAECPFCGRPMDRPHDITARFGNVFAGGACKCGAVYVYDRSGHNLGDAYVDALTYACHGDPDTAWSLTPDEDYKIRSFNYDWRSHSYTEVPDHGRRVSENLLFILITRK